MRFKFKYKNHKGLIEERDVDIVTLAFDFTTHADYGYQPSWFIGGWDYSRGRDGTEYRSFYLSNIVLPEQSRIERLFNFKLLEFPQEDAKKED